jgi:hypothetical protein
MRPNLRKCILTLGGVARVIPLTCDSMGRKKDLANPPNGIAAWRMAAGLSGAEVPRGPA